FPFWWADSISQTPCNAFLSWATALSLSSAWASGPATATASKATMLRIMGCPPARGWKGILVATPRCFERTVSRGCRESSRMIQVTLSRADALDGEWVGFDFAPKALDSAAQGRAAHPGRLFSPATFALLLLFLLGGPKQFVKSL